MINPIVIIITVSVILSMVVVCVINKPRKPLMTATMILLLIFYLAVTFIIDSAITGMGGNERLDRVVGFLVMNDTPSYDELAESFKTFMTLDITLVITALVSMFGEIMLIFRKESKR